MRLHIGMYSFQTADASALADFWGRLLEIPVDGGASARFASLNLNGDGPTWLFHWPSGGTDDAPRPLAPASDRFMIDLADHRGGVDREKEGTRAEESGATGRVDVEQGGAQWSELRDPDGNLFRIFGPRPE